MIRTFVANTQDATVTDDYVELYTEREAEDYMEKDDTGFWFTVETNRETGTHILECEMWYCADNVFKMEVSCVKLPHAIQMFIGAAIIAQKAESGTL